MPRRLLGACLVALTALTAQPPRSVAKPPDLSNNPVIIVQLAGKPGQNRVAPQPGVPAPQPMIPTGVMQDGFGGGRTVAEAPATPEGGTFCVAEAVLFSIHPLMNFLPPGHFTAIGSEEACEEGPARKSPRQGARPAGCPVAHEGPSDKHACAIVDADATPTVLENLKALEKADACVRQAKKHLKRGQYRKAADCLAEVGRICPGAPCAREAAALRSEVLARARAEEEKVNAEEEQEEPVEGCNHGPLAGCLSSVQQMGMCQFNSAVALVARLATRHAEGTAGVPLPPGVEGKLSLPVSVDYRAVPLRAVLTNLGGSVGVPIVVHEVARGGTGDPMAQTVSLTLNHVPVRHVLDVVVRPLGLEPVVRGDAVHITAGPPADSCRMPERGAVACEACPWAQKRLETTRAGIKAQVDGLIKACYLAVEAKRYGKAAELARQAHAMDPTRVEADPLVYKMHLLAEAGPKNDEPAIDTPAGCPAGAAGEVPGVSLEGPFKDVLIKVEETSTGRLMFGAAANADSGPPGSILLNEGNFDLPAIPLSREYLDDRAFRGAGEKEAPSAPAPWLRGVAAFLVSKAMTPLNTDQPGGCLMFGISTGGINVYCKAPARGRELHFVIRGGLPLVWITSSKAAD